VRVFPRRLLRSRSHAARRILILVRSRKPIPLPDECFTFPPLDPQTVVLPLCQP
jgi:hypothetical protein